MATPREPDLQRVIDGDSDAFAALYACYRTPAIRFCTSLLKDADEAENIVHEVFLKIWTRREQINPVFPFSSYLFTSLRNQVFDYLRRLKKDEALREQYLERVDSYRDDEPDPMELRLERLQRAIERLPERRRQILTLTLEQGKSYREIADLMRISTNTVKNQLVKAKQFLRDKTDLATV
jgi:RNA polymerase sigma-70 factor (family 1)